MNLRLDDPAIALKGLCGGHRFFDGETRVALRDGDLMGAKDFLRLVFVQFHSKGGAASRFIASTAVGIDRGQECTRNAWDSLLSGLYPRLCLDYKLFISSIPRDGAGRVGDPVAPRTRIQS